MIVLLRYQRGLEPRPWVPLAVGAEAPSETGLGTGDGIRPPTGARGLALLEIVEIQVIKNSIDIKQGRLYPIVT